MRRHRGSENNNTHRVGCLLSCLLRCVCELGVLTRCVPYPDHPSKGPRDCAADLRTFHVDCSHDDDIHNVNVANGMETPNDHFRPRNNH